MKKTAGVLLLLVVLAPSVHAALQISSEQPLSALFPAPPEGPQSLGAIASDGNASVVFWSGMGGFYATPVTAEGDPGGRALITLSGVDGVSACWTGFVYLTTWHDVSDNAIYAASFSRAGVLLTSPYVVVVNAGTESGALASNGRRSLLAYADSGTNAIRGALFNNDGTLISINLPLPITDIFRTIGPPAVPHVATDGNEFALLWRSGQLVPISQSIPPPPSQLFHTFHLQRLDDAAASIAAPITIAQTPQTNDTFGFAFGSGVYAIDAIAIDSAAGGKLVRFTVDPRSGVVTTLPSVVVSGFVADVLWNGSSFVAYWMDGSQSSSTLMTLPFSGAPEASMPVAALRLTNLAYSPLLVWNGTSVLGAWSEYLYGPANGESAIRGTLFDPNAAAHAREPVLLSVAWSRQFAPSIATSGSDSLVVWIDSSAVSSGRLVGVRITMDGTAIDSTPFEIGSNAAVGSTPLVAFVGGCYVAVWQELNGDGMVARRVGRDGLLGPRLPLGGRSAAIASNSEETLIALTGLSGIVGYRFNPQGEPLDTRPISISNDYGYLPKVATNGTDFLVVWNVGSGFNLSPNATPINVYGTRVFANGSMDASTLAIATGPVDRMVGAVGSDGRDYTVFFGQLEAKRVLREGQLDGTTAQEDGTIVATNVSAQALVATTTGFWVAGLQGPYYTGSIVVFHTDFRGNADAPVMLASYNTPLLMPASVSLAETAEGHLQIAYARRLGRGLYSTTSRVFFRQAYEMPHARVRSARH